MSATTFPPIQPLTMPKKPTATKPNVFIILDKSGSMTSIQDATIEGFNAYLQSLKDTDGEMRFSLTLFDTVSLEKPVVDVPVKNVHPLTKQTYRPNGGTPLYDAVCDTLLAIETRMGNDVTTPCLVMIITDGQENSSHRYNLASMQEIIKKLTDKGNWTFAYQGANVDVWTNAQAYGVPMANAASFTPTPDGVLHAYRVTGQSTSAWYNATTDPLGAVTSVDNFFDPGQTAPVAPPAKPKGKTRKSSLTTPRI